MTTLTVGRVTDLPRVNLLPPEVAQAAQFRRLQVLLGLLVAATVAGIGMLYLVASGQVSSAQSDLDAAQAENASLKAEVATYADIPRVQADLARYEADLTVAMGPEVRWSFYLNDLSLSIPSSVRLTSMNVVQPVPSQAAGATATVPGTPPVTSPLGTPGIATITFEGKATSYDAVASWLQMLAKQKGYTDPTVTEVAKDVGTTTAGNVFTFSSSVTVTEKALSGRYLPTDGE
jgi:type IV pilus assembly protein PilN